MEILENTALSLGKKIRLKEIGVREAVKASLDQINRQESKIHAFLDVDEKKVYARVKEVEEGIKAGRYRGPLAGVPIAVGGVVYLLSAIVLKVLTKEDCLLLPKGQKIAKILKL